MTGGWPAGLSAPGQVAATGIGSLPGTDPREAVRMVLGELPDLPFLPELPARGPHADLTGRTCALLAGLHVDLQPSGWRITARPSRDGTRARDLLARDLDALEETEARPAVLKVQSAGPWTLAATVELSRGDRLLADHAAVADLAASLAEGLTQHLADLARRLPGTTLLLQLDEPALPTVLAGQVPTASGFGRLRTPDRQRAVEQLRIVLATSAHTVVHCCAPQPPVSLVTEAGAGAVSVDGALLTHRDDDDLGVAIENGMRVMLGLVPGTDTDLTDLTGRKRIATELWRRLGFPPERLPEVLVVTPACGLAGASPSYARDALQACVELARRLGEEPA